MPKILFFLTLIFCSLPVFAKKPVAPAGNSTAYHQALAERALELMLVSDMLAIQEMSSRQIIGQNPEIPPEKRQKIAELLAGAMDWRSELPIISKAVQEQCDIPSLKAFNRAYSKPVAVRINRLSLKASEPAEQARMKDYLAQLESAPPSQERIQKLLHLDALTSSTEITADSMVKITARVANLQPDGAGYQEMEEKVRSQIKEYVLGSMLFSTREASDKEIAAYVALHENPQVAKVEKVLFREAMNSILNIVDRVMTALKKEIPPAVTPAPAAN